MNILPNQHHWQHWWYQGVKPGTLSFTEKYGWWHILISNQEPSSLSLHHYVQLEKRHSHLLPKPCKIEKQMSHGIRVGLQCLQKFTGASLRSAAWAKWGKGGPEPKRGHASKACVSSGETLFYSVENFESVIYDFCLLLCLMMCRCEITACDLR